MSAATDLAELVEARWSGELDDAGRARLDAAPAAAQRAVIAELRLATAIGALLAAPDAAATADRVLAAIAASSPSRLLRTVAGVERRLLARTGSRSRRWSIIAGALAAGLLLALVWWRPVSSGSLVVEACGAEAQLHRHGAGSRLTPGMRIRVGDGVDAGDDALRLRRVDGSTLEAVGGAALRLEADDRLWLERGALRAEVTHQRAPLHLITPDAEALVLGTRFLLRADAEGTRLEVEDGRVRLTRSADGAATEVAAGEYAVAAPGAPPAPRRLRSDSPYRAWRNGPSEDPAWFPIGVWSQDAGLAETYRDAGITLYVGLAGDLDAARLSALRASGMALVCPEDAAGIAHAADPALIGWLRGEAEPVARDPTRPRLRYQRRGESDRASGDADIRLVDFFPLVAGASPEAVRRLRDRLRAEPAWGMIEVTIGADRAPLAWDAWMSLILGARGVVWFVHGPDAAGADRALVDDPGLLREVAAIDRRIAALAPVLNAPAESADAPAIVADPPAPVLAMVRRHAGDTYVVALPVLGATRVRFTVPGLPARARAEVLDEARSLAVEGGGFADDLAVGAVHIYRIH